MNNFRSLRTRVMLCLLLMILVNVVCVLAFGLGPQTTMNQIAIGIISALVVYIYWEVPNE